MALNLKSNGVMRGRLCLQDLSADITLTNEDSGKVFLLDAVGEDIIIPAPSLDNLGVHYTFIINTKVENTTNWTITSGGTDKMFGQIGSGGTGEADTIAAGTGQDSLDFVKNLADEGDFIKMFSTGTKWLYEGQAHATANIIDAVE